MLRNDEMKQKHPAGYRYTLFYIFCGIGRFGKAQPLIYVIPLD